MKKTIVLFIALIVSIVSIAQTLQSPDQFLGYKIGTHYTPHSKILSYLKSLAQAKPDMVKLEKYGETYEGRDLMIAYITSPENLRNLETIRQNNIALTGLTKSAPQTNNAPAIVWLSYNVHGNEASSSEAAMQTLYSLVDPTNSKTKEWLKNTVVILDPCINPDGRERYVNWFNSVVGKNYNVDPQSREHNEPWPGGRTNHYNFDLNRDWAWQTQAETQQRIARYRQWYPQIHVDFHEQGFNEPYYFAPAAEPFHEVITPWQREFQTTIGKSNAHYFDENGWLYFTRQQFDLFYPSYGDTYPLYNGAIGMTYEQGGIRAGLGIVTNDGDTLTLVDRVQHHYTTSLSTIETAFKNATQLVTEFKKFFENSRNATGSTYKTYVLTSNDEYKLASIRTLLDKNGITYGSINGKVKGFHYFTGKDEEGSLQKYSLAISAYQPKSTLVKVLFEPKGTLSDSITYDITAWAVPYTYGVDAFALKEKREIAPFNADVNTGKISAASSYGVLFPYTSVNSAQVLAYLLKNNVKVRMAEKPFTYNNKNYDRGTLIVVKTSNASNWISIANEAANLYRVQPVAVTSGFVEKGADFGSSDVRMITAPKVALLTGEQISSSGAGEIWHFFEQTLNYPVTLINANDLARINLKSYNVLIIPDGRFRALADKNMSDKLKEFVRSGGKLIAIQGAVEQLASADWGIKLKEATDDKAASDSYDLLKKYSDRERTNVDPMPGAIYKVELDNTHPLAFGYPNYYYTLRQDKNVYEFMNEGWNVGVIKKNELIAGFVGYKLKNKMKDGLLFGVQDMGAGSVVYMADDPLFRLFWENGKLMFANAVFMVGQ